MRHVTDDAPRDRAPVFTRDGQWLAFYSNRDGAWAIWGIRTDGSNLHKIAGHEGGIAYPVASPIDDRVVFSSTFSASGVYSAPFSGSSQPALLEGTKTAAGYFFATSWSRDGSRLSGPLVSDGGRAFGFGIYDLQAHTVTAIASDETFGGRFLPDGRRVVYFTSGKHPALVVVDSVSHQQ